MTLKNHTAVMLGNIAVVIIGFIALLLLMIESDNLFIFLLSKFLFIFLTLTGLFLFLFTNEREFCEDMRSLFRNN